MERMIYLLDAAATALDDKRSPFDEAFLIEHDVTITECMALSSCLADGARILAWTMRHPKLARGAVDGANLAGAYQALNAGLAKVVSAGE